MSRQFLFFWIVTICILLVIARFAYLATLPSSRCNGFFGRDAACAALEQFTRSEGELYRRLRSPAN